MEYICETIVFILAVILFAAWAGLLDKYENMSKRLDIVERRYKGMLKGLRDSGFKIEFYEGEVKESGTKQSDGETEGIVAAVVVTPPGFG